MGLDVRRSKAVENLFGREPEEARYLIADVLASRFVRRFMYPPPRCLGLFYFVITLPART